jgi:hypothetical protein
VAYASVGNVRCYGDTHADRRADGILPGAFRDYMHGKMFNPKKVLYILASVLAFLLLSASFVFPDD